MKLPRLRRRASRYPAPVTCPKGGKDTGVRVLFGLPTEAAVQAAERGEVALGGCIMADGDARRCTACHHSWTIPTA